MARVATGVSISACAFQADISERFAFVVAGAPASRSFAVRIGSFHGTRTIGTAGVVEIAASIPTAAWKSTGPCWRSVRGEPIQAVTLTLFLETLAEHCG